MTFLSDGPLSSTVKLYGVLLVTIIWANSIPLNVSVISGSARSDGIGVGVGGTGVTVGVAVGGTGVAVPNGAGVASPSGGEGVSSSSGVGVEVSEPGPTGLNSREIS